MSPLKTYSVPDCEAMHGLKFRGGLIFKGQHPCQAELHVTKQH